MRAAGQAPTGTRRMGCGSTVACEHPNRRMTCLAQSLMVAVAQLCELLRLPWPSEGGCWAEGKL